jgi:hypothetical protein
MSYKEGKIEIYSLNDAHAEKVNSVFKMINKTTQQ